MKEWIRKMIARRQSGKKSRAQSMVEFAIMLPVLLIMLSGLVEFGFMLNYYLDIIDAAREAARFAADDDPIRDAAGNYIDPNPAFYTRVQTVAKDSINVGSGNQITLDCTTGDVVISAFSILNETGTPVVKKRWPVPSGENGLSMCNHRYSNWTSAQVAAKLDSNAPSTGLVMVEIYYDYHMVLGLPWIRAFVPDPVTLYAYSMMPNANVEPTPTP
jgi:hypothetical protein